MVEIEEFYVIAENGTCVFARTNRRDSAEGDLIAGFLNAINLLSTRVNSDTIQAFGFGNHQLIVHFEYNMQFVALVTKDTRMKAIRKQLQLFATGFFEMYPPEYMAKKWRGNLGIFASLNNPFNKFIANPHVRMQAAIW